MPTALTTLSPDLETEATAGLIAVASLTTATRGRWRRAIHRLVVFSHCRVELPSFRFSGRDDPVAILHRLALILDAEGPSRPGVVDKVAATLLHALNALRQTVLYSRQYGAYVARSHMVGRWRQWRAGWTCLFRNNQLPRHYYERHLFAEPDPSKWLEHIEHRHLTVLLGALNRGLPDHRLTNKLLFAEHCRMHGLPAAPTLAAWNGTGREIVLRAPLPAGDLFAKPFAAYGSMGTMLIPCDQTHRTYGLEGRMFSHDALAATLAERAVGQGCLLQPRLRNGALTAAWFGDDDVANIRLVTGLYPGGRPQPIAAGLRVPSSFTTRGDDRRVLMAPISLADGRLGAAHLRGTCGPGHILHPDTGALLAGAVLPQWADVVALALQAHATCPWMPFVGWDLIESDRGLLLLEANAYWGANVVQMPGATPLGGTEFPAIYLAWHRHLDLPGLPERRNQSGLS